MAKPTGPTNPTLQGLIREMKKNKAPFWQRMAKEMQKSTRSRRKINTYHLNKQGKDKEILVVPGKVLAQGAYTKKNTVVAWQFSKEARKQIEKTAKTMSLKKLLQENPKAKGVRIIG